MPPSWRETYGQSQGTRLRKTRVPRRQVANTPTVTLDFNASSKRRSRDGEGPGSDGH